MGLFGLGKKREVIDAILDVLETQTLSADASTIYYAPWSKRSGSERILFLDSQDREWAVQAIARIQGGGYDPVISLKRYDYSSVVLLGRKTRITAEVDFFDNADQPLVLKRMDDLRPDLVAQWDTGTLTSLTVYAHEPITNENLETMMDVLNSGTVNLPLTERFSMNLDKQWNTPPEQPLEFYHA